jgi:hypothetical protein
VGIAAAQRARPASPRWTSVPALCSALAPLSRGDVDLRRSAPLPSRVLSAISAEPRLEGGRRNRLAASFPGRSRGCDNGARTRIPCREIARGRGQHIICASRLPSSSNAAASGNGTEPQIGTGRTTPLVPTNSNLRFQRPHRGSSPATLGQVPATGSLQRGRCHDARSRHRRVIAKHDSTALLGKVRVRDI